MVAFDLPPDDVVDGDPNHSPGHNQLTVALTETAEYLTVLLAQGFSVTSYGAVGDGVTNDTAAFTAAAAAAGAGNIVIPAGTFKVTSLSLTCGVIFAGGTLVNSGTVTFGSPILAPVKTLFTGAGAIVFTCFQVGFPEWWGARLSTEGGTRALNRTAMQACYVACAVTQLRAGTYLIDSALLFTTSSRVFRGVSNRWGGTSNSYGGTRILVNSATADVVNLYTDTVSNDNTTWVRNVTIEDVQIGREIAATGTACGIRMSRIIFCTLNRVNSAEHLRPYVLAGVIDTELDDCYATNSSSLSGTFSGFYFDGSASIGLSGGNGSVTVRRCTASCASAITSYGFHLTGRYVDTFLESVETTNCDIGIYLIGNTGDATVYGYNDVQITSPILDTFKVAGIRVEDQKADGMVAVNGGYAAPKAGSSAVAGIHLDTVSGQTAVANFEVDCGTVTTCAGVSLTDSTGFTGSGVRVTDSVAPLVLPSGSDGNGCQLTSYIRALTGVTLVTVAGDRNVVDFGASGNGPTQFTNGVAVTGDGNVVTVARVNPALVTTVYTDSGADNTFLGG